MMQMARLAIVILIGSHLVACRSQVGLTRHYNTALRPSIVQGNWSVVAENLESAQGTVYKKEDRVMFWLNSGVAFHYAGNYSESSKELFKAEETMQDLFTKSISEEIGKYVVSESIQTYPGEDFERTLSYLYTSINAYKQGRVQDALVEARRADEFLRKMRIEFEKEDKGGTLYSQDAFVLWFIGLLLEVDRSYADAYSAYLDAYKAYTQVYQEYFNVGVPKYLYEDLMRLARLNNRQKDVTRWAKEGNVSVDSIRYRLQGYAEVIVIHGSGEAPYKKENTFTTLVPDGYTVRVAIPELVARGVPWSSSRLVIGGIEVDSERAEPVESIGVRNFKKRENGIKARAIARAIIKYGATKATSEAIKGDGDDSGREVAGAIFNILGGIASAVSEGADLRSWTLLPAEFRVARAWVPPGRHTLEVFLTTKNGAIKRVLTRKEVVLRKGERHILSVRSID